MTSRRLRLVGIGLVLVLAACGGSGSDDAKVQGTGSVTTGAGAATTVSTAASAATPQRAAARWETVATYTGSGPLETPEFTILPDSIQWRIRWSCESGTLRIESIPPPRRPGPMVDAECPKEGDAFSIQAVPTRLNIDASGPWKVIVDQQVETPLNEPLLAEAASAPVLAEGAFYNVEKVGKGTARLYQLPDGRRLLRFEDFEVSQNTDLFVWLSEAAEPRTTVDAVAAPKVDIGNLKSTVGTQNYFVPPDVPTDRIRSIVIWCEPVRVVYSAASLTPA